MCCMCVTILFSDRLMLRYFYDPGPTFIYAVYVSLAVRSR